jgi:hypothetical protein
MTTIKRLLELDEFIYFLGYLWADGSIPIKRKNITLSIQEEDALVILPNFDKINNILNKPFTTTLSIPKNKNWKNIMRFYSGDMELYRFLIENDYNIKSNVAPYKILNLLPKDKIRIFMLGFFDGDGCVYNGSKLYKQYSVSFSGPYDYDWTFIESIFSEIKVSCKVNRCKRSKGSNSVILTSGMFEVEKIYNYLYSQVDSFCVLGRKKIKFEEIIERVKLQTSYEKGVCYDATHNRYMAYFNVDNKRIHLGSFKTEKEAIKIRKISIMIYKKLLAKL